MSATITKGWVASRAHGPKHSRAQIARSAVFDDGSECWETCPINGVVSWVVAPADRLHWQAQAWAELRMRVALARPGASDAGSLAVRIGPDGPKVARTRADELAEGYGPLPPGVVLEWLTTVSEYMAGVGGIGQTPYMAALDAWEHYEAEEPEACGDVTDVEIVKVGPGAGDQWSARELERWVDLGREVADVSGAMDLEQLRDEVRRKVDRWRAIAVDWGIRTIDHVAALAQMDGLRAREQLDALEATVEQTIRRMARGPDRVEPARWRAVVGQDPTQPMGVVLEQWVQLDNLEGSGRAGRPWGWRAEMVYRSAQEAQQALLGIAVMKTRAAKQALEQAQQFHQLAQALPDATSGEPIDVGVERHAQLAAPENV